VQAYGLETTSPCPPSFGTSDARLTSYCEVYDFGSGCICCSPDGDLTRELSALSRERQSGGPRGGVTHAIVETTGLADPRPFTRLIGAEGVISHHFSLDRVVTVLRADEALRNIAQPAPKGIKFNKCVEQVRLMLRLCDAPQMSNQLCAPVNFSSRHVTMHVCT
jgi:G3E family GTPase